GQAALLASAALGKQVAALLDSEMLVAGVTSGAARAELRSVAVLTTVPGGAPDYAVNAGWGHLSQGNVVMPGRGKLVSSGEAHDVYLNDTTYWRQVPMRVWDYTIGGYQVLKKWLSYRETGVLGRTLHPDDTREFMLIARRITALVALEEALNANYQTTIAANYLWPN
ncbi:MAG: DNA methyltransferase, partial [Chloroflexota bacterium]|nr:DNA methyltransferase [Chloroflexota bacterium]